MKGSQLSLSFPFLLVSHSQLQDSSINCLNEMLWKEGTQGLQNGHQKGPPQPIPRNHTSQALHWHSGLTEFLIQDSSGHLRSSNEKGSRGLVLRHQKLSHLHFDSILSSDPGIAHQLHNLCLHHSL